jgi:hypothetical protein
MTLDEAREFITFLRGKGPDGFRLPDRPRLGKRAAFTVLYVLQERFRLIPDTYEECAACTELFDTTEEGGYDEKQNKHFCESCEPHYSSAGE